MDGRSHHNAVGQPVLELKCSTLSEYGLQYLQNWRLPHPSLGCASGPPVSSHVKIVWRCECCACVWVRGCGCMWVCAGVRGCGCGCVWRGYAFVSDSVWRVYARCAWLCAMHTHRHLKLSRVTQITPRVHAHGSLDVAMRRTDPSLRFGRSAPHQAHVPTAGHIGKPLHTCDCRALEMRSLRLGHRAPRRSPSRRAVKPWLGQVKRTPTTDFQEEVKHRNWHSDKDRQPHGRRRQENGKVGFLFFDGNSCHGRSAGNKV